MWKKPQNRFFKPQANPQNYPYAPTYNLGWRQYPNFSYKNPTQGSTQPPPGFQAPQEKKSYLEDLIKSYITSNEQLANNLSRRPQCGLPSNTEKNPKEEVNAVTLKSGKELEEIE